jgi:hypothetical protein
LLITVALADPAYRLTQVLDTTVHESFHALEDKLLTDQEMQVLKREDARLREVVRRTFGFTEQQISEIAGFEMREHVGEPGRRVDVEPRALDRLLR